MIKKIFLNSLNLINIALIQKRSFVIIKKNKIMLTILNILKKDLMIFNFKTVSNNCYVIYFAYTNMLKPKTKIKKIMYVNTSSTTKLLYSKKLTQNTYYGILSTSYGILSYKKALTLNIKGRMILFIKLT